MSYANPNFTIITSGGCNSHCDFCTDSFNRKASPDYLANLARAVFTQIPEHFSQVSVSGGEPTLSADLPAVLKMLRYAVRSDGTARFKKIVMTTNGARLIKQLELVKETVGHLNVSRHAIGYADNVKVFGTKDIVTDQDLAYAAGELNKAGIDVNLNHVYGADSKLTMDYVLAYVDYARSVGATSVSFRYDQNENTLEPTYLEKMFSDWKTINEGSCPVCRNHSVLVKGMPVVFKASVAEPSKAINDVYELIYHITGKLTTDWEGLNEFTPEMASAYAAEWAKDPHKQHAVHIPSATADDIALAQAAAGAPVMKTTKVTGTATGRQSSAASSKSNRPKAIPIETAPSDPSYGGGCGGSYGGGCGSRSILSVPSAPVVYNYGGGCGGGYGGGCGSR